MKIKKLTALAMTTAMCAATIFGCGGSNDGSNETTGTSDNGSSEPKKVSLLVWGPAEDQDQEKGAWLQTMCDKFNEAHPEWDITFKYDVCSEADAKTNVTKDPTVAGDIYFFPNDQLTDLLAADAIAKLGGTVAEYVKSTNSETMVATVSKDGNIYGLPFTGNTWFMYYDKRVFTEDDVKSLDTMLSKAKVAFPLTNSWYIQAFYAAAGGVFCGANGDDADAGIVLGDNATEVTKYLVDLVKNPNFLNDDQNQKVGITALKEGTVGAIFTGSWDYDNVKSAIGEENVGICQLPTANIGGKDVSLKAFAGSKAIGVNPNCKNMEVAVALAQFLASEEAQLAHYEMRNIIPCNTKLLESDAVKNDILAQAQSNTIANTAIIQPANKPFNDNWWSNAEAFGKSLINGEITADNAEEKTNTLSDAINGK